MVQNIKRLAIACGKGLVFCLKNLLKAISYRYTVVFVPHTEKRVYNFQISVLSICCFILVFCGALGAFFWYGSSYNNTQGALSAKDSRLKATQASLDQLRDETASLMREARGFMASLSNTLSRIGSDASASVPSEASASGDLSAFFEIKESAEGTLRESEDIRRFTDYLASTRKPIEELGLLLDSQGALLTEIPSIWPIKGGIGHVSMFFGQNPNPFTGQYYIHKGIDLSTYRYGDPVIATADGQVVTVDYEAGGFGNYVIIKHKHGFFTRYAHLQSFRVTTGQKVQQGEVIGYIGNTGLSTGPHVHYEIHIGSDVVDPYRYLSIRSSIARNTTSY